MTGLASTKVFYRTVATEAPVLKFLKLFYIQRKEERKKFNETTDKSDLKMHIQGNN